MTTLDVDLLRRNHRATLVARTLGFAATALDDDVLLLELAERVTDTDWTTPPAVCPLCEEADCPYDCPLAGNRR